MYQAVAADLCAGCRESIDDHRGRYLECPDGSGQEFADVDDVLGDRIIGNVSRTVDAGSAESAIWLA